MKFAHALLSVGVTFAAYSVPAFAQDELFQLPEQCTLPAAASEMDHAPMGHGSHDGHAMDDEKDGSSEIAAHIQENMRRMMVTMPAMEEGIMQEDPDVAFACAMIAHHQGAIDMAQVLLKYGDDPEMIELAEEVIAAQAGEIEQMKTWLEDNVN
ncbi:DUF305 domain-containing protein [Paracoccus sp. PARArs4]|uniref:CopM family metallochaperone n=1 Tax=Paracoccus sp. PARArs4 TaxID=2853442 RepID=UPI0024A71F6E|nr:DUF305 domain-containing protein [Paracoccus sp. PARArs4]